MCFKYYSSSVHLLDIIVLLFLCTPVLLVRNRDIKALSDHEYDIMIRKILGSFDTPVTDRTKVEIVVIRKYYRWIRQGHDLTIGASGRTIYLDGKQLLRIEEKERAIKQTIKESKNSGSRKLAGRLKTRFAGCSEGQIITSKSFIYSRCRNMFIGNI